MSSGNAIGPRERVLTVMREHPGETRPGTIKRLVQKKYHVGTDHKLIQRIMAEAGSHPDALDSGLTRVDADPVARQFDTVHTLVEVVARAGGIEACKAFLDVVDASGGVGKCRQVLETLEAIKERL